MDQESPSEPSGETSLPTAKGWKFKPWLFFGVLFVPGILSMIVLSIDSSNYGEMGFIVLLIASVIAGVVCGIHFTGAQRSMAIGLKIFIGIVAVVGCAGAAFALGIGQCFLVFEALGKSGS